MYIYRRPEVNWQLLKNYNILTGAIVFHIRDGTLILLRLNEHAAKAWLLLNGELTLEDILNKVNTRYVKVIKDFIGELYRYDLICSRKAIDADHFEEKLRANISDIKNAKILRIYRRRLSATMKWEEDFRKVFDLLKNWAQVYRPLKLNVDITNRCNLRCQHCYFISSGAIDGQDESEELSFSILKKIIDRAYEAKIMMINFFGGEPLMRSDLFKLIDYAISKNMKVSINTNGLLLTPQYIASLAAKECGVIVSIDGHNKITHEATRGKNTFDRLVENIVLLDNAGIDVTAYHVVHKRNVYNIFKMYILAKKLRINTLGVLFLRKIGKAANDEQLDYISYFGNIFLRSFVALVNYKNKILSLKRPYIYISRCDAYLYTHCDVHGNINFCQLTPPAIKFGNLQDSSLLDIWHSEAYQGLFDLSLITGLCKNCIFKNHCKKIFECRLQNSIDGNNDFYASPVRCLRGQLSLLLRKIFRK